MNKIMTRFLSEDDHDDHDDDHGKEPVSED